ncbi:MAG: hypothetical protein CM1200mP2_51930 [Planctomycetaceae bacterium]|nr:MAG: hypothetical protein CM1200mP2_51930 [Planctomycetaceae bacterium]
MTDYDFRQIVGKPDNVPIVALLYLVGGFTWLYFYKAVENDRRLAEWDGEGPVPVLENDENEKVLVWPDLVYSELICMIAITTLLIVWGIVLEAPLEEPASSAKTPNPSKAPWYFLGLQEMLVYFDPWLAGVVFPTMILGGLMAIFPTSTSTASATATTFSASGPFRFITFLVGFITLWVAMIVLGKIPAWSQLEHLRDLRVLGCPQARSPQQRHALRTVLPRLVRPFPGHAPLRERRPAGQAGFDDPAP